MMGRFPALKGRGLEAAESRIWSKRVERQVPNAVEGRSAIWIPNNHQAVAIQSGYWWDCSFEVLSQEGLLFDYESCCGCI